MRNFRRPNVLRTALLAALFLLTSLPALATEDWSAPARALENKIAGKLKPGHSVVLSVRNSSSLTPDEVERVRTAIDAELRAQGFRVTANSASPEGQPEKQPEKQNDTQIRITLAENLNGFLWVAEITVRESREVVMQAVPHGTSEERPASAPAFLLRSQKLLEQEVPILDFALDFALRGPERLLVLEPDHVVLRILEDGRWQAKQSAALGVAGTWPRDLRGRLRMSGTSFEVFLAGVRCRGTATETLSAQCSPNQQAWDLDLGDGGKLQATLAAGKNFFGSKTDTDGGRIPGFPPFFSAAAIKVNRESIWALTGVDGRTRFYDPQKEREPVASIDGWGSDMAALKTDCGSSWQILATRVGDWTERDAVQAFEIPEGQPPKQPVAVSQPLEFSGPVMALWPATPDGTAGAVIRNLQTGRYEAHTLSLSCSR